MQTSRRAWGSGIVALAGWIGARRPRSERRVRSGAASNRPRGLAIRRASWPSRSTDPSRFASVGDVMIRRPASMLDEPAFQSAIKLLRDADIAVGNMEGNPRRHPAFRRSSARDDGIEGRRRGPEGDGLRHDEPRQQSHLRCRSRGHGNDSRTADGSRHRARRHRKESRGRASAAVSRHAEGTHRDRRDAHAERRPDARGCQRAGRQRRRTPWSEPAEVHHLLHRQSEQLDALKRVRASVYTPPAGTTNATRLRDSEPADRVQFLDVCNASSARRREPRRSR